MAPTFLLDVTRAQAEQGVDFMTLHADFLLKHIPLAMKRIMGIVSRRYSCRLGVTLTNHADLPSVS